MIPKIVNTNAGQNYNWKEKAVSRFAPFATNDTPATSVKIIGGRLMIVENSNNNSNGPSSDVARKNTPARLTPVQGKTIDAYRTGANESEANKSQHFTQTTVSETQRLLTPHYLLPPIPRSVNQTKASELRDDFTVTQSNLSARRTNPLSLERHLLDTVMLPDKPVRLRFSEEVELRDRVAEDLRGLSSQALKDVYLELTAFDPKLTGYVHFSDLIFTLLRSQVNLTVANQRLLAALFLSESVPNMVDYEKFLYFLSSSMKRNRELMRSDFMRGGESELQDPSRIYREPADDNFHNNSNNNSNRVAPTRNMNQNKRTKYNTHDLMRAVEEQLKERDARHLDIDRIWDMFRHADPSRSQVLSRDQIKTLAYRCNIQLDEDVLDQVIDRCHKGNDRYWWEQFLNFIGRFLVHKTGLDIPERSKDFVKPNLPPRFKRMEDHVHRGLVSSRENQLAEVEKKEKEIARLEKIIQSTRQRLIEIKRTSSEPEPWLNRFLSLAHAMYEFDENKTGYLTPMLARWLTREYSQGLKLGLSDEAIQMAIRRCSDDGSQAVSIEHLLRTLMSQG